MIHLIFKTFFRKGTFIGLNVAKNCTNLGSKPIIVIHYQFSSNRQQSQNRCFLGKVFWGFFPHYQNFPTLIYSKINFKL